MLGIDFIFIIIIVLAIAIINFITGKKQFKIMGFFFLGLFVFLLIFYIKQI